MNFPIHFCDLLDRRDMGVMQKTFEVDFCADWWGGCGRLVLFSFCLLGLTHCFRRDGLTIFRQCIEGVGKQREKEMPGSVPWGKKEKTHQTQPKRLCR